MEVAFLKGFPSYLWKKDKNCFKILLLASAYREVTGSSIDDCKDNSPLYQALVVKTKGLEEYPDNSQLKFSNLDYLT